MRARWETHFFDQFCQSFWVQIPIPEQGRFDFLDKPSISAKPSLRAGNENEWPNLLPSRISGARVRRERGGHPNPHIVDRVETTSCRPTPTSEVERAKERDPDHNTVLLVPPTSLVPRYAERAGSPERVGQYWIQSECVATRLGPDHLCLHAVLKDPCQKISDQQSVRHFGER